jgi:hypothetical protein
MKLATRINKLIVSTTPLNAHTQRGIARNLSRGKNRWVKIGSALNPSLSIFAARVVNRASSHQSVSDAFAASDALR